jgi:hypothetical protein
MDVDLVQRRHTKKGYFSFTTGLKIALTPWSAVVWVISLYSMKSFDPFKKIPVFSVFGIHSCGLKNIINDIHLLQRISGHIFRDTLNLVLHAMLFSSV